MVSRPLKGATANKTSMAHKRRHKEPHNGRDVAAGLPLLAGEIPPPLLQNGFRDFVPRGNG